MSTARAYGPHRVADEPTMGRVHDVARGKSTPAEVPISADVLRQRRQINTLAHAATLAEAVQLDAARPPAAAGVVIPNCCGTGWTAIPSGRRNSWLFTCATCQRALTVLDGTYEEVMASL